MTKVTQGRLPRRPIPNGRSKRLDLELLARVSGKTRTTQSASRLPEPGSQIRNPLFGTASPSLREIAKTSTKQLTRLATLQKRLNELLASESSISKPRWDRSPARTAGCNGLLYVRPPHAFRNTDRSCGCLRGRQTHGLRGWWPHCESRL